MILQLINMIAAAVILIHGLFFVVNGMTHDTPTGIRVAWAALTTGALGVLAGPLFGARPPTLWDVVLTMGIASYILSERRIWPRGRFGSPR
jgi:hypothetical protein